MESKTQDVITLLKKDHQAVKKLFKQFSQSDSGEKDKLANEICNMLTVHEFTRRHVKCSTRKTKCW